MDLSFRGKVFNQWLADLPQLVIRVIGTKKSKMNEAVKKELAYLLDRRSKAIEDLRTEYNAKTNYGVLLTRPSNFPWIKDFTKASTEIVKKNPGGGDYLVPVAQELIDSALAQSTLAKEKENKFAESEWNTIANQLIKIRNDLAKYSGERSIINASKSVKSNSPAPLFASDTKQMEDYNRKYFRPSCLSSLNIRNLNDMIIKIHQTNPSQVSVPSELMISPVNTIINYYSILREAVNAAEGAGCGTVGMMKLPYPMAYNFLSLNYQKRLSYEEYLKTFNNIAHINLIKVIKNNHLENTQNKKRYYIELELISPPGRFEYSFGIIDIVKEDDQYKIDNIEMAPEDYFCAPYHFWQHNAEMKIDIIYGNWYKLLALRYPTIQSDYKKYIYMKGTDGNNYLFIFIKLTNGTDFQIGQYKQSGSGEWFPFNNYSFRYRCKH